MIKLAKKKESIATNDDTDHKIKELKKKMKAANRTIALKSSLAGKLFTANEELKCQIADLKSQLKQSADELYDALVELAEKKCLERWSQELMEMRTQVILKSV